MISKINESVKILCPKINAFEAGLDKKTGFYNTNIFMDMGYTTLEKYAKAVNKCKI